MAITNELNIEINTIYSKILELYQIRIAENGTIKFAKPEIINDTRLDFIFRENHKHIVFSTRKNIRNNTDDKLRKLKLELSKVNDKEKELIFKKIKNLHQGNDKYAQIEQWSADLAKEKDMILIIEYFYQLLTFFPNVTVEKRRPIKENFEEKNPDYLLFMCFGILLDDGSKTNLIIMLSAKLSVITEVINRTWNKENIEVICTESKRIIDTLSDDDLAAIFEEINISELRFLLNAAPVELVEKLLEKHNRKKDEMPDNVTYLSLPPHIPNDNIMLVKGLKPTKERKIAKS